jgi:hypothetical protein
VVVVVGTVVGGTYLVVVVVLVVVGLGGVVLVVRRAWVVVVFGRAVVVVVDVEVEVEVEVVVGVSTTGLALLAMKPTRTPEATPEPRKTELVSLRTRAKRRSRCCGVRGWGVIDSSSPRSLVPLPKRDGVAP